MKKGFTLAEVLITLTIIGAVAALTIPELVKNMNDHAYGKAKDTFDMKITEAMNQMKTNNEMDGYLTSEKFVDTFQKYMKISKRCTASNLTDCFSAKIYAADGKEVDTVAKLRTGKDFGKSTYTSPLSAVQFTNGTSALISYDPACVAADAFNNQANATGCLSILYDVNGFSKPNKANKDLRLFNVDKLGTNCVFEAGGSCFGAGFQPVAMSNADCATEKGTWGISVCCSDTNCPSGDYWAGAVKHCGGIANMPTSAQLLEVSKLFFPGGVVSGDSITGGFDPSIASSLGLSAYGSDQYPLWSSELHSNTDIAWYRYNYISSSKNNQYRGQSWIRGVCVLN